MNRLPEVKKFIFEDFEKKYEAGVTHFKKSPGKPPVMHFLDEEGNSKKQVTFHFDLHQARKWTFAFVSQVICFNCGLLDGHL